MHALVCRAGPASGQRYEVSQEMSIGRANAAITVADTEVSRRHAVILPVEGGIHVEDLGSTNGTWLNGQRIAGWAVARNGGVLRVGRTEFDVLVESPVAETVGPQRAPGQPSPAAMPTALSQAEPPPEAAPGPQPAPAAAPEPQQSPPLPPEPHTPVEPVAPPQIPFSPTPHQGFASSPQAAVGRGPATRSLLPLVLTIATIGVTAVLLVLHFGLRG